MLARIVAARGGTAEDLELYDGLRKRGQRDPRQALEQLRSLILGARDQDTLADAWLFTGQHLAAVNAREGEVHAFNLVLADAAREGGLEF